VDGENRYAAAASVQVTARDPEKWQPVFGKDHVQKGNVMQPLSGLLVLDFTTLLPGPLASLMLAEAGAEVLKIERPGGEDARRFPPFIDGESAVFAMLNRGKQVLTLDLKGAGDRAKLIPLIQRADILLEQFRPGVMGRLGFGYEDVRSINPRLIYCSISGYGQSGARVLEAGHDINYIGNTGLLDLQPGPIEAPVLPPMLAADIAGGSFPAVINILLALRARDQSGQGCRLDIAMSDAMFTFGWAALALGAATGKFPKPGELWLVGASPRYRLYPTKDGKLVACGAIEQKFWAAFSKAIGLPAEFVNDLRDPNATRDAVAKLIAARTSDEWRPIFAAADCCTTIVVPLEQAMRDPHFVARGLFDHKVESASGKTIPALPLPIAPGFRDRPGAKKAPPLAKN
jgi:alpha-methylacyl-CoA racemase